MTRKNSQLFILVFLGVLTAFGPFVTDMYLPTLPAMTGFFHTTSSQVQLGLTASMIGLAVGQLFFRSAQRQVWPSSSVDYRHVSVSVSYFGLSVFSHHHAVRGLAIDSGNGGCWRYRHFSFHRSR